MLLHLVDGTSSTITKDYRTIVKELEAYSDVLGDKPRILALNKTDAMDAKADHRPQARAGKGQRAAPVHVISGVCGQGPARVLRAIYATHQGRGAAGGDRAMATVTAGAATAPDIRAAKRLVVKIGSALLVDRKTGLKQGWLSALALDVAEAKLRGTDVVLVSSGSIALGRKVLDLPRWRADAGAIARPPPPSARSVWPAPMKRCWPRTASPPRRCW